MHTFYLKLNGLEDIQALVSTLSCFETEFDLIQGHHMVDAKSILGICSLNLSKVLKLLSYSNDPEILHAIEPFQSVSEMVSCA